MTAQTWVSVALAVIAAAALVFTGLSTRAAIQQTRIQDRLRKAAAQPYVWADLRPDGPQRGLLLLVVGNSGPTVATDVRVRIDPVLSDHHTNRHDPALSRLRNNGIASLAPGRVMEWPFGAVASHMPDEGDAVRYTIEISGQGPFGPLELNSYSVDLEDLRMTWAVGDGSMRLLTEAVNKAAERIAKAASPRR